MKATSDKDIFARGRRGTRYLRRRIPTHLRDAFGGRTEIVRSLGTADARDAAARAI